jgi:exodeoxyribonuclease-5
MIAGFDPSEGSNLLEDLIAYVQDGDNCKLVFMGDNGQLPPVGQEQSPVFSSEFWKTNFPFLFIYLSILEKVVRTDEFSSILENATYLRSIEDYQLPLFCKIDGKEVISITGLEVKEILESSYDSVGQEQSILLTLSNKRANKWNQEIRASLLFREEILERGDRMMVVKNNYFWLDPLSEIGFIANGEIFTITKFIKLEEQYGFEFAHVRIQFSDTIDEKEYDVIILLEALISESPNIPRARLKELFFEIEKDYSHERNKSKRYQQILKNPYFNALQVKYANAITVHKSQGGQWEHVFIDYGFIPEEMKNRGYLRWLYTAVTRATKKLYLVNFPEELMG